MPPPSITDSGFGHRFSNVRFPPKADIQPEPANLCRRADTTPNRTMTGYDAISLGAKNVRTSTITSNHTSHHSILKNGDNHALG